MCANLLHEQLANIQKKWENTKHRARLSSAANSQSVSHSGLQYILVIRDIIYTNYCHIGTFFMAHSVDTTIHTGYWQGLASG